MPPRPHTRRAALAAPLCAGALLLGTAPAVAAPDSGGLILTAPSTAAVGETVTVELQLEDAVDVYAYALTVEVDPAVLTVVPGSATGPGGGFDSTEVTGPGATVVHSRLGSSPALAGDVVAGLELDVVGPGTSTVDVAVELVGADGSTTPGSASAQVVVPAPPTPDEPEEPTDPGRPSEPAPAPDSPAPTGTDDTGAPAPGAAPAAPGAAPPAPGGGSLPSTGVDARGLGAAAVLVAALGGAALLARRRAGGSL